MLTPSGALAALSVRHANTTNQINFGQLVGDLFHGIWRGVSGSVWGVVGAGLFAFLICVRVVHAFTYPSWKRDPIRRFSRQDKAEILRRAGGRCEHHGLIVGRCEQTTSLEADHIIPWSRSGPTSIGNGQALCRRHNRDKRASIPTRWQLRAIARRRATYFPAGISGEVIRRPR